MEKVQGRRTRITVQTTGICEKACHRHGPVTVLMRDRRNLYRRAKKYPRKTSKGSGRRVTREKFGRTVIGCITESEYCHSMLSLTRTEHRLTVLHSNPVGGCLKPVLNR